MRRQKFYIPKLSAIDLVWFRIGGPGLGNLLFPISRALIGAIESGGVFINGTFPQIKIGPLLRGEKDKRFYSREFAPTSFRRRTQKLWLMLQKSTGEVAGSKGSDVSVIYYSGLGKYFYPLLGWEKPISDFLFEENFYSVDRAERSGIAVHLRFGDFAPAENGTGGKANAQNSLDWYRLAINRGKELVGNGSDVILFSDDVNRAKLAFPEMRVWEGSPNALSELLTMSRYEVLVGANSTFSLWASFLGNGLSIWHKNLEIERYRDRLHTDFVV